MKRKLTITIPSFSISSTGGERMVISLANNLVSRGHKVNIVYIASKNPIWYPVSKKVNLISVSSRIKKVDAKTKLYSFVTKVNKLSLKMPPSDIFLANWVFTILPCMANSDFGKTIFLSQGNEVYDSKKSMQLNVAISHMAYMLNIPIIAPSNHLKKMIKERFNNKATIIPPFVNNKMYKLIKKKLYKKIRLLFVGDIENKNKGFKIILSACKKLPKLDFELHIATQKKFTQKHKFPIFVHKPRNEKELAKIYNNCTMTVNLSKEEGFGLTLLESMACGNVCLTTETGGNKDFAINNNNCLLVERDATVVSLMIKKVAKNINYYKKLLSKNAINTAKKYNEKRMIDSFEELFLKISNNK